MGVSYLEYEYPSPYHSKVPLYEMNGQPLHYVSTPEDRDHTQPFQTVPWTVEFKGCCRWFEGKTDESPKPDEVLNFVVKATVDLSNHVASPRLVSLPFLNVRVGTQTRMSVCALSAGGKAAMVRKNGGTINYEADDNTPATFTWAAHGYSALVEEAPTSKNGRCIVLVLGRSPGYQYENRDYVTLEVKMGDVMVTGDYTIYAKGPAEIKQKDMARGAFGCQIDNICEGAISLGKMTPVFESSALIDFESVSSTPLEVRYIVATSSSQTTLLATSEGTVKYSLTEIGEDHAGLPVGATLAPVGVEGKGGYYVTNLDIVFTADKENTRPGVDQFISSGQRDYTDHYTGRNGWHEVVGSNFNKGVGGAHVSVYMEKASMGNVLTDHRHMAAITGVELANPGQVAGYLAMGYHKLDKNLLEQSARGEIFVMYRKGSGPPVTDVSSTPKTGYKKITASTSNTQSKIATATLYVKYNDERRVSRSLIWTPCTGQDEEIIICASANAWNVSNTDSTQAYGSMMQCMLMDVMPMAAPRFTDTIAPLYTAHMGQQLEIRLQFKRTDAPLRSSERIPVLRFGEKGGAGTQPTDPESVLQLLTGRTKTGSRITGADKSGSGLSPVTTASDASAYGESSGYLLWTPSPYQGGWHGEVCLDACVDSSACPAYPGGPSEVCSQTCFRVSVERCKWVLVSSLLPFPPPIRF